MAAISNEGSSQSACPLCSSGQRDLLSQRDRHGEPLDTAICTQCGLVTHASIPTADELTEYYASQYRMDYHHESAPSPRRVMRAWRQGTRLLNLLSGELKPGATVLEIGAGIGCTVKAFEIAGYRARGIEPGADFQAYSHDKLHAPVERATLEELPTEPTADLILLVHVIEHLRDPLWALKTIASMLNEDGLLYVECPNLGAPFARPRRLFHRAHIFNFTGSTLEAFARKAGLEIVQRFGSDDDPNLAYLFRRGEPTESIDRANYENTLAALGRYNIVTYHLRLRYLSVRVNKLSWRLLEHTLARLVVARLLRRCADKKQLDGEQSCPTE